MGMEKLLGETTIPTVLVRNEEFYIADVVRPLAAVFGKVLVGDTGSTDRTREMAASVPGVEVIRFGEQTPHGFTECRRKLGMLAYGAGATWQMLVDGDELYTLDTVRYLAGLQMPEGKISGFTLMVTLHQDATGMLWESTDVFNRHAFMPADTTWNGDYPFDVPGAFDDHTKFVWFDVPDGHRYHAVHLHRLQRSPLDMDVFMRKQKQHLYALGKADHLPTRLFYLEAWRNGHGG